MAAELDPLLEAAAAKLPPAGTVWPAVEREAWFRLMRAAFDVVFGVIEAPAAVVAARDSPLSAAPPLRMPSTPARCAKEAAPLIIYDPNSEAFG